MNRPARTTTDNPDRAYLLAWLALAAGGGAGLALAWWSSGLGWDFSAELARARSLGVVSLTVLAGYPKSLDVLGYGLTLGLPVAGALAAWWAVGRDTAIGARTLAHGIAPPLPGFWRWLAAAFVCMAYLCVDATYLRVPGFNPHTGAWPFLGEQGATLAWVESIRGGGVYGRDFFCLYGPMFIYPLAWLMDVFTPSALVERGYLLGLNLLGYAVLAAFLLRTLRSRTLAFSFAMLCTVVSSQLTSVSANATVLRSFIGLVSILSVALWSETRQRRWLIVGGLVLGQSTLFSQEAGFSAGAGVAVMLAIEAFRCRDPLRRRLAPLVLVAAAFSVSVAPMLVYLLSHGAGAGLLDSLVGYPRLAILGFGSLRFPSLHDWLGPDFFRHWLHYAVIFVYVVTAVGLFVAAARGNVSSRWLLMVGLLVFGIILFRQALGRSTPSQTVKVMVPALALAALWLDELWRCFSERSAAPVFKLTSGIAMLVVLLNLVVGILLSPHGLENLRTVWASAAGWETKLSAARTGELLTSVPRAGVYVDPGTARTLVALEAFLEENTAPGEPVYFFPNEAIYYFLFERSNPTRYPVAYFATETARQREVIADLERVKPRYIIYSPHTWRQDDIPEAVQIPEISRYISEHYYPQYTVETTIVLRRSS